MTLASEIVDRVRWIGATFELTPTGFNVRCAPGSMPAELISVLHQHKPQVRAVLAKGGYSPVPHHTHGIYPHARPRAS